MEVREPDARHFLSALQETEVGPTPFDWSLVRLDEITDPERPISYGIVQTGPRVQNGVPCLRVVDIQDGKILLDDLITTSKEISNAYRRTKLREGDLVVPLRGKVGECAQVEQSLADANLTRGVALVAVLPKYSASYCKQFFSSSRSRARLSGSMNGSALQEVPIATLRSFKIAIPPTFDEQDAIAKSLADADALIDSLEQLLTKKRQLKQGAMQVLLTGKRRLPEFEATWTDGVLGDVVAELVAGVSVNSDPTGGGDGVPSVVKTSALKGGVFDPSECKPIIQADLGRAATPLRQDTLLISRMNTPDLVGEVGYVDRAYDQLYLPDRIWMTRMRGPDCVCVRWLGYLLSSTPYKRLIGDTATGTSGSMKNIAKGALLGLPLRFPEVDEQRAIAAGLADLDAEIAALNYRLTKARALKQAMAQSLLTGRIRLVEPAP